MAERRGAEVVVAGAGIGGLATALALRRHGFGVIVLERSAELREIGAGLTLWPNGTAALAALGVGVEPGDHDLRPAAHGHCVSLGDG